MKLLTLLAIALPLFADDAPAPTVEQLQAQLAAKDQQIAEQAAELRLYQQGLFQCQATQIHAQAEAQVKADALKRKPESK